MRIRPVLILAIGIALASHARADDPGKLARDDTVSYRVRPGDTLSLVAAEFYGDHQRTTNFLMAANNLRRQRKLSPGEKLRVPVSREITTAKGDTFATLAKSYLGDPDRAAFLAEYNKLKLTSTLATGTGLTIPMRVVHTAAAPETLEQVSQLYFGDAKQAEMLRVYNHLDSSQLDKNDSLIIPNFRVRVRADKLPPLDAGSIARREQQRQANADALRALPLAHTAWLQADFAGVKTALAGVANKLDFLEPETASDVGILLGKAFIAFDDAPSAIAIFSQVLARQRCELSAYFDSPKVIAAWKQAGGSVRSDSELSR